MLQDPVIQEIADAHGRSVVQVILRWHTQIGSVPLPKAAHAERQAQNLAIFDFELTPADVERITALGRPDGRLKGQDPATYEEF